FPGKNSQSLPCRFHENKASHLPLPLPGLHNRAPKKSDEALNFANDALLPDKSPPPPLPPQKTHCLQSAPGPTLPPSPPHVHPSNDPPKADPEFHQPKG